jgi:hemerythrin-like metal-binding protein
MEIFKWNENYSVGIEIIDKQHKELVRLLAELFNGMQQGKGNDILLPTLQSLANYTISHFETEEKLMDKYSYPETKAHKSKHAKLRYEVNEFLKSYSPNNTKLTIELMNYLNDWLKNHIIGTDKKFGQYLVSLNSKL